MKKIFKSIGSIILSAAIIISSFNLGSIINAQPSELHTETADLYSHGAVVPISDFFVPSEDTGFVSTIKSFTSGSAEQVIYDGLKACEKEIDLKKFNLSSTQLKTCFENVSNSCPDLFYVANKYLYYTDNNRITIMLPEYLYDQSTIATMKSYFNMQMSNIIDLVNPDWSDLEKIIFIHDYLAQNFEYDTSYTIYDAYNFFVKKKGVCQAYTSVFAGLMSRLKIEAGTASSNSMNHIWNTVKLNGKWYHVDVTWDDPSIDNFSLAHHRNLLLSDSAIQNAGSGHYNWVSANTCSDTTYDNAYWRTQDINSPYVYTEGKWYYTAFNQTENNAYLFSTNNIANSGSEIQSLGKWTMPISDNVFYTSAYSGLYSYNNKIYFNTQDAVYYYTPANGSVTELCRPSAAGKVFGLRIDNQTLTYGLTTDYSTVTTYTYKLETPIATVTPSTPEPTPVITVNPSTAKLGDANIDGNIDLTDVLEILKAALGITTLDDMHKTLADVDEDNVVTLDDAIITLKIALGIN